MVPNLQSHIRETLTAAPFELSPNLPFIRRVANATQRVTRRKTGLKGIYGFTDARHLRPSPRRTIVILEPGSVSQAHVANEHMPKDQLLQAVNIYSRIIGDVLIKGA